jgi:hypothetical protein
MNPRMPRVSNPDDSPVTPQGKTRPRNVRGISTKIYALLTAAGLLAAQGGFAAPEPCRLDIEFPPRITASRMLVFGEMHGTEETPRLVGEYVCKLTDQGDAVLVGLEMPEQEAVDRYLDGDGSASARDALFAGSFWETGRDGRSSDAMFRLIERLRELRALGRDVAVVAFDDGSGIGGVRDAAMAEKLRRAIQRHPGRKVVALMGNVHAKRAVGSPIDPGFESMTYRLDDLQPFALWVDFIEGSAWVCMASCGVWQRTDSLPYPTGLRLGGAPPGFDGTIYFPTAAASPPAVTVARER